MQTSSPVGTPRRLAQILYRLVVRRGVRWPHWGHDGRTAVWCGLALRHIRRPTDYCAQDSLISVSSRIVYQGAHCDNLGHMWSMHGVWDGWEGFARIAYQCSRLLSRSNLISAGAFHDISKNRKHPHPSLFAHFSFMGLSGPWFQLWHYQLDATSGFWVIASGGLASSSCRGAFGVKIEIFIQRKSQNKQCGLTDNES